MNQVIRVQGLKEDILELKGELETRFEEIIMVSEPVSSMAKLNSRQPYRQNELFDILISIAVNLASTLVYEQCKQLIEDFQRKKKVEVHIENNSEQAREKEEKSQNSTIPPSHTP